MKLKLFLKDPDGVYESLHGAAEASVRGIKGLTEAERDALIGTRHEELDEAIEPWVTHGEIVVIEIDTEAGTARVCKADERA